MKKGILGIHRLGGAVGGRVGGCLVVPDVTAFDHRHIATGAANNENVGVVIDLFEGSIDVGLQRYPAAATKALIGGDDQFCLGAIDAIRQSVGREATKDDGVDRADTSTGQHGIGRLGDHRQIENDAVALLDAEILESIGELADALMQLGIGNMLAIGRDRPLPR